MTKASQTKGTAIVIGRRTRSVDVGSGWSCSITGRRTVFAALCVLPSVALLFACAPEPQVDQRLSRAVASVQYMTSERFLSRSAFRASFAEPRPSDFVEYIFSDFGVAEWPIALDEMERAQLAAARIPALPDSVALVPHRPDPTLERQVVIRADDGAGLVVVEAYERPDAAPVLTVERRLDSN